jgi:hypothetical protein
MTGKLILTIASLFLMSSSAFAASPTKFTINQANFTPVHWHATMQNGGFTIQNQANKTQYVQVAIESGEIYVYTVRGDSFGSCQQQLNADQGPYSVVCQLAPGDIIAADLDFSHPADATGTYQVKI